jgi:Na+/melibiose symporter-like transporter
VPSALRRRTVAGYAIGSLGTGGFGALPGLVLLYYMTDSLGITALAGGLIVSLAKLWDVIIDPLIGSLSDRMRQRTGTRRTLMLIGALSLPVFFTLTFAVPAGLAPLASALWVLVAFVLSTTAFSLFQVPYIALPVELSPDYDGRTRLLTWRVVVLTIAILLFGAGGPLLRGLGDDPRAGYLIMAIIAGVVISAGLTTSSFTAPRGAPGIRAPRTPLLVGYRLAVDALRESRPLRALLGAFVLQALATGIMLAAAQYVATWILVSEDAVTLLFLALIAPAVLVTPLWGRLARRFGKERSFVVASVIFGIATVSIIGVAAAPGAWIYVPVGLAGAAYAGMQALPLAMLPDVIAHDGRMRGDERAGVVSGVWTAGETAGIALGATVLALVLAVTGYIESTAEVVPVQPDSAVLGIALAFSLVPAVLMGASLLVFRGYRLRRDDIDIITPGSAEAVS